MTVLPTLPRATALLALMLSTGAMAQSVDGTPGFADGTILTISAQGRVNRTPDLATVRAGVTTQAASAAGALADNAARMGRVVAALRAAGIAPQDLSTASVSLQPQYRYADGQPPAVTGYQASNSLSVRLHDVSRAGRILDALVAEGANQIDGPTLSLANPDAALDEARADAVKRARARADLYARAAGLHVERIVSMTEEGEESVASPQPIFRVKLTAAPAPTQILPGQTDVTATLSVRFLLR